MAIEQLLQRPDLQIAVECENEAYDARVAAFLTVKETYIRHGHGPQTYQSMKAAQIADTAWRAAKIEADRIRDQLRTKARVALLNSAVNPVRRCTGHPACGRREREGSPTPLAFDVPSE